MSTTFGNRPNMMVDFQSYAGPGDKGLRNTEIEGYQPVSRIGEVVMNAFGTRAIHPFTITLPCSGQSTNLSCVLRSLFAVDSYEFTLLEDSLSAAALSGKPVVPGTNDKAVEFKPHFHEWATVQPGMICLARKKRTAVFRQYVAAETAVPVTACAACLPTIDEKNYFFAGVARSKSVRDADDGIGPKTDEFFTVSIGGMATLLNNSGQPIHPVSLAPA